MQAIETRYLSLTNSRGARIKARAENGESITINHPSNLSGMGAHARAAVALCKRLGWDGTLIGGATRDGYCFVFASPFDQYEINLTADERAAAEAALDKRIATLIGEANG